MTSRAARGGLGGRFWVGALGLAVLPLAPFLEVPWAAAVLLVVGAAALVTWRLPARFTLFGAGLLILCLLAVSGPWPGRQALEQVLGEGRGSLREAVAEEYRGLWVELTTRASQTKAMLGPPPLVDDLASRQEAFRRLADLAGRWPRLTLLLVDPDGEPFAWAGEGLLYEPGPGGGSFPREGPGFFASFAAVTLVVVEPLGPERRTFRVVAGRSFANDSWPFPSPPGAPADLRWSLAPPGSALTGGAVAVAAPGYPSFVFSQPVTAEAAANRSRQPALRGAWALLALLQGLTLAGLPGGPLHQRAARLRRAPTTLLAMVSALFAGALALGATGLDAAVLALGFTLAAVALRRSTTRGTPRSLSATLARGGGAFLLAAGLTFAVAQTTGALDLGSDFLPGARAVTLRAGLAAALFGLLLWARSPVDAAGRHLRREGYAWIALVTLALAAAGHDAPPWSLGVGALGASAAAVWASGWRSRSLRSLLLALFAAVGAATLWETAYRFELKQVLGEERLLQLEKPNASAQAQALRELTDHFTALDLAGLVPRPPDELEPQDLAYALWRGSPLVRTNCLSALKVTPLAGGAPRVFSFGPLLDDTGQVIDISERGEDLAAPNWDDALVVGGTTVSFAGSRWAQVQFWLLPRPGFLLAEGPQREGVELGLLSGRPAGLTGPRGLPSTVRYGLYAADRRAVRAPWREAPPLVDELAVETGQALVETPAGRAWGWSHASADGWTVLFLPVLQPGSALERVGVHALGNTLVLLVLAGLVLAVILPRRAVRDVVGRAVRSYSQRLILVFTSLLLVPLVLLNLVVLSSAEQRILRGNRAAGEAALAAAQQVLTEFLGTLKPGVELSSQLDAALLRFLSRVAQYEEINLYWDSSVYASSKRELFAAGLLPQRIPGEIFERLALLGFAAGERTNRVGNTTFLELYVPVEVEGGGRSLFLSMPLLAQEAEVGAEVAALRRQVILVSCGLFLLLVGVGLAFARRFSGPIEELVEGTRRIAAGATSLELRPTELELAALGAAIDEMARRIAESRDRLVREKEVVERMVENITSGVVSIDRERRVLLHNRVAAELLGTAIGERIDGALAVDRLWPVASFLATVGTSPERATVRLPSPDGGDDREWSLVWVPVPGAGEPSALLVVEDATEILRGQRLLAWAEMARIIAHEIKNPLTPIRLTTEHLREVYHGDRAGFDRIFDRCVTNILRQVDELRQIASEFSTYSSIPRVDPQPADLVAAMAALVEGYGVHSEAMADVTLEAPRAPLEARFDGRLLGRAIRNLIENSLRVSRPGDRVVVRLEKEPGFAVITVLDEGPGVEADLLSRIFDPYFSTHDTGTGLGLPIARRIAEEHGGSAFARNRTGGGLEVLVRIPLS